MKNLKKLLVITFLIVNCQLSIVNCFAQNIGINEPNPDNSAILEMTSTEKGLLLPRMTTVQRDAIDITGNPESVIIFNTDVLCFQTYVGGQWNDIWCYTLPPFTCGTSTVDDIDGNTYNTVLIGSQCWLKENMRTTKYPDGSAITKGPSAHGAAGWDDVNTAYYSCPPNTGNDGEDCAAAASLGMLYQWKAAMDGSTVEGAQGICPAGWHVATDAEWKTLEGELGMSVAEQDATGWRGTNEGSKMANHVADQNWTADNLTGDTEFNTSGLVVGPSGFRNTDGNYYYRSNYTLLWSSTESAPLAWRRDLDYTNTQVHRDRNNKANGFSVRCLKD